jgi:exopolysaccharide biosynthesis polyprenyl glycosylphosphotransferase
MGIAPDRAFTPSVASPRIRSGALRALPLTALMIDLALVTATVLLAALGRSRVPIFETGKMIPGVSQATGGPTLSESVAMVTVPLVIAWIAMITLRGGYDHGVFGAGTDEYKVVVNSSLLTAGLLGVGCYLTHFQISRGFFVLAFVIGPLLLVAGRYALRCSLHRARRRGSLTQRTMIVGGEEHVDAVASVLARESWLGYDVLGALTPSGPLQSRTEHGVRVLGEVDEAAALVRAYDADVVFVVAGAFHDPHKMRELVWDLESDRVQVVMAPGVTDVSSERIRVRPVAGLPLLHLDRPRSQDALRWAKRTFDIIGSATVLALASPVMLWTAWQIKRHDGGPVLFRQTRVGRDGDYFTCLKFRSMVVDAERVLTDLHSEVGYEEGLFKLRQDPRITKPGRWIRRYSLDELPQLINVLRGDMSLVGPRPPLPLEVDRYTLMQSRRLRIRPGLTGLWQVSGRSDLTWDESIRLDLYYVDNWSMIQDVAILGRTIGAVLSPRGAY